MCVVSTGGQNLKLPSLEFSPATFATFDCAILITFEISMENTACSK